MPLILSIKTITMRKIRYDAMTECPQCSGLGTTFICISCEEEETMDKTGRCEDIECLDDIVEIDCHSCEGTGEITLREHVDNQY